MNDLFNQPDPVDDISLRDALTAKWKTQFPEAPDDLIKSKVDSDLYIKTLEQQKDDLRTDYMKAQEEIQKSKALEEVIDRLNLKREDPLPPPIKVDPIRPSMNEDEIAKVFDARYEAKKQAEIETRNFNEVQNKLRDRYGTRAAEILTEQREALGLTKDDVNSLAKKSPEAFFRMLGLNQEREPFMAPPRSDVRNDNFAPKTQKRTYSFYEEMRTKNPKQYWDPKTQVQMHKDGESLGAAFFDDGQPVYI